MIKIYAVARLWVVLGLVFCILSTPAWSETLPGLGSIDSRRTTALGGEWHYMVDPQDVGSRSIMGEPRTSGYFFDIRPDHSRALQEYDFSRAAVLTVPGSWNAQIESLQRYDGIVWLQRDIVRPPTRPGARLFLQFEAANYRAEVFLNGKALGQHEGGFTPFAFEVTDALRAGANSLVVKVDSELGVDTLPASRHDWWNFGGLTRDVLLIETPPAFIRDWRLQLDPRDPARAIGWVQVDSAMRGGSVEVRIDGGGVQRAVPDASGWAALDLRAPRERWSPETPRRHRVEINYGSDRLVEQVGFRTIEVRGREILLNGAPVFLRGISLHEVQLGQNERAATEADARALLQSIRDLNGNFARLAHYPHNRHMARVADELGIMLWAEIPVYWAVGFDNPQTLALAQANLDALINRDGNRASVIIWSVANETPISAARNVFLGSLIGRVRTQDPTRLVTAAAISTRADLERYAGSIAAALEGAAPGAIEVEIDDPIAPLLDVLAFNQYLGWYDAALLAPMLRRDEAVIRAVSLDLIPRIRLKARLDKPLLVSEFGAEAVFGRRDPVLGVWSEDLQAEIYRRQMLMIEASPGVAGVSPWVLQDFWSPRRPLAGLQDDFNRKGLVDEFGRRKLAFDVLATAYARLRAQQLQ